MGIPVTGASASASKAPDLFTQRGIDQYLASHGINPRTAVEQSGRLNYVGDACPGKGWHCLAPTHTPVVQVAPRGGVNVYHCTARPGRDGGCFVLQVNAGAPAGGARQAAGSKHAGPPPGTNEYVCAQYASGDTVTLDSTGCAMNQTNTTGDNDAAVLQLTRQTSAGPQSASETAGTTDDPISQTNDSGANRIAIWQGSQQKNSDTPTAAQETAVSQVNGTGPNQAIIKQQVSQKVSDGATEQDQEATQALCLTQDSPSGKNQATVGQQVNQQEKDSATGADQYQNQEPGLPEYICGSGSGESYIILEPNLAALVSQDEQTTAATGPNKEKISQALNEQERSTAAWGAVSQQQGSSAGYDSYGGLQAIPSQDSTGVSRITAHQNEQQTMHAASASATQDQYDPIRQPPGYFGYQESNPDDVFQLFQDGTQLAGATATQIYDLEGDCLSSGSCDVQQSATSNAGTTPGGCTSTGTGCSNEVTDNP